MTILFAGDTHGKQRWLGRAIDRIRPRALVHVGDIELQESAERALAYVLPHTRFLWVAGNHDFDSVELYERLHAPVMMAGALHGRVMEVDGLRIAGLGGTFRGKVWYPPAPPVENPQCRRLLDLEATKPTLQLAIIRARGAIWWDIYEQLWSQRADVLVCHEAPSCHRHGFAAIDDLARAMGVSRIFHGHHHNTYQAELAGGIRVFGVGLRAIIDLDGQVVYPGDGGRLSVGGSGSAAR